MEIALNRKGQAALTDALYFLLIVSALSTMLFFYASGFGSTVQQRIVSQYQRAYATSALETILYSSTPRIAGQNLDDATEIDYLLAAVKEDFADDGEIVETKKVLKQNIFGIMQPRAPAFDYLFYFYLFDAKQFPFVMLYTREKPTFSNGDITHGPAEIYFCNPNTLEDLDSLVESVGLSAQGNARIEFVRLDESGRPSYPPAQANLTLWVYTPISEETLSNLNCELYETISE